jgi:hypothetical protein
MSPDLHTYLPNQPSEYIYHVFMIYDASREQETYIYLLLNKSSGLY